MFTSLPSSNNPAMLSLFLGSQSVKGPQQFADPKWNSIQLYKNNKTKTLKTKTKEKKINQRVKKDTIDNTK